MSFGRAIRQRRQTLHLTLEDLAERSGLSPNYIGTIENDRRDPSLSTMGRLADGLKTSVGELLGPMKTLSPEAHDVARQYDAAPDDVREAVLAVLRIARRRR